MMTIVKLPDGRYAVRDLDQRELDNVLGVFASEREADEWMLSQEIRRESAEGLMKPGAGEGIS